MSSKYYFLKLINQHENPFKAKITNIITMNKWTELFVGLILIVVAVAEWGLNSTGLDFGVAALEVLKGGVVWFVIMMGLLFIMLGISDLKE